MHVCDPSAAPTHVDLRLDETGTVELASLHVGRSIREQDPSGDLDPLPTTDPGTWEPIVVSCSGCEVVDGHRRVRAALALGATELGVRWFIGDETDAIAEFVRLNTREDSGLSRAERQEAAKRILRAHPTGRIAASVRCVQSHRRTWRRFAQSSSRWRTVQV